MTTTEPAAHGRMAEEITARVDGLDPVGLDELARLVDLQRRFDPTYLVPVELYGRLLDRLGGRARVLEVDGRRSVPYHNVYFDTDRMACFLAHVQGRRQRYKVRTRHYGDPATAVLELKTKALRGRTVKYRAPHPGRRLDVLDEASLGLLAGWLGDAYGAALPDDLTARVVVDFRRTTLADPAAGERVTVDRDVTAEAGGRRVGFRPGHVIIECKSERGERAPTARALRDLGVRPLQLSKYCVAVGALWPALPHNRWRPAMRRLRPVEVPSR